MNAIAKILIGAWIAFVLTFSDADNLQAQGHGDPKSLSPRQQVLRDRQDYVINSIATADIDELVARISESDGEYFNLVTSSAMQPSFIGHPWVPLRAILVDRRVAKLYQLFAEMPRDRAAITVSAVYEQKLDDFKRDWKEMIEKEGNLPEPRRHGLAAALFLCLEFCGEREFEQHLQSWVNWYQANRHRSVSFSRRAGPDELMVLNLYVITLAKRGESMADIDLRVEQMCDALGVGGLPELHLHKFVRWDATEANRTDPDVLIAEYPVFFNWGSARQLAPSDDVTYEISRRALTNARAWVQPPSLMTQWVEWTWKQLVEWTATWFR